MTRSAPPAVRFLRGVTDRERLKTLSDGELLTRYGADHDEAAFEALVGRHGAMVLQVCRSFLRNEADAEDAFQVTFLALARQARSVRKACSRGSGLYGVAYHTALKSRRAAATRRRHEAKAVVEGAAGPPDDLSWREAQEIFYEELAALPEKYRAPLVLCYLEGQTNAEAAQQLGWTKGTVSGGWPGPVNCYGNGGPAAAGLSPARGWPPCWRIPLPGQPFRFPWPSRR